MTAGAMISNFVDGSLTVKRRAAGALVAGRWVDGAESTFSIVMSVQPAGDKELMILPEGQRTKRVVKGYTATFLQTANKALNLVPDRVVYDGVDFEVQQVEKWVDGSLGDLDHYKVIMAEVNV